MTLVTVGNEITPPSSPPVFRFSGVRYENRAILLAQTPKRRPTL